MRQVTGILIFVLAATTWAAPAEKSHWAWQPLKRPAVPESSKHTNPIDAFIVARLKAKGLELAPEADRRTLIRRLTFNITGLPPTLGEINRFLNDGKPGAYERFIDHLLASVDRKQFLAAAHHLPTRFMAAGQQAAEC